MDFMHLGESEYRFACIVWEHEPIGSGALVSIAQDELGWKKSTTYTVLKNLIAKGVLQNDRSIVTAKIPKSQIQAQASHSIVARTFDGSLPQFIAAFLNSNKLSEAEANEIATLIAQHKEGD